DQVISEVEIGVAGRDALVTEDNGARHGQLDDGELLAVSRARGFQALKIFNERSVVGIAGVGLDGGDDGVRRGEAGDVVNVTVRIIAGDAAVEPDDLVDGEVVVKGALKLLASDARIALLHAAEKALFGGEQRTGAAGVDGAALEDKPVLRTILVLNRRLPLGQAEKAGDAIRQLIVERPIGIFSPAVKPPVGNGEPALRVA